MKWHVWGTQEAQHWTNALEHFSSSDIYFLPEYHQAYELNGDGKAYAFIAREGEDILFYPFFLRPIQKVGDQHIVSPWYDIETVYGYSGPLSTTNNPDFLAAVWMGFDDWCQEMGVIAEFIRFNPLLQNQRCVQTADIILDRETVVVNLDCSEEDLWKNYPGIQRTEVRKAIKNGLICSEIPVEEGFVSFIRLYKETMERTGASCYYFFSDGYFEQMKNLDRKLRLFNVLYQDQVIATALFLLYDGKIHYHLSGSNQKYRKLGSNNLLLHTVACWGIKRGFRELHLGGGRTPRQDDSLFRFKASTSRHRRSFYIGKRIHNQQVYENLCSEWMHQKGLIERPSYFLLYRQ